MFNRAQKPNLSTQPLLVFDTHPIQYRSPVFRQLAKIDHTLKVYFFNSEFDSSKFWFHEVGKSSQNNFGVPLETGFINEILYLSQLGWLRRYSLLKEVVEKEKPRAILIFGYYLPEHWMLRLISQRLKVPLIFVGETYSRGEITSWRRYVKEAVTRYFFGGVSQFISIGKKNWKFYRSWNVPAEKITQAHYCVDNDFFKLSKEDSKKIRESVREELGIPPDAFVILYVGRLFSRKRPKDVLQLHERFSSYQSVHTILVGSGEMESDLKEASRNLKNCHLVGFKNQEQTKEYYHVADMLFVPSEYETWGLVVNEAMASGIPAVVTEKCGAAHDLVLPNETGFVFREGDLDAAESMVRILITNPERRFRLSENAKRHVNGDYTPEHFAKSIYHASR